MGDKRQIVVEIDFPSGTRRYSFRGVRGVDSGTPRMFKPMLRALGRVVWGVPVLPGRYRPADIDIIAFNRDQEFSDLKNTTAFYNSEVRVRQAETSTGLDPIATGVLDEWRLSEHQIEIHARDTQFDKFDSPLEQKLLRLTTANFPRLDPAHEPYLVPLVYGANNSPAAAIAASTGPGVSPCYRIDPAQDQTKYRYVAAQSAVHSVPRVFVYETLQASSAYSITTATYGGTVCTVVDFTSDPKDSARGRDIEVTCDIHGIKDGTGALIENPVAQLKHFLTNYAPDVVAADIADGDFTTAQTSADTEIYKGALVLADRNWTFRNVIDRFTDSFMLPVYTTRSGKISCYLVTRTVGTATVKLTQAVHILENTFRISGNREVASQVRYHFDYNWFRAFFNKTSTVIIANEKTTLGRDVVDERRLMFCRDSNTARRVARVYGNFLREKTLFVDFDVEPEQLPSLDLNTWIGVTHKQGIGTGGWSNRVMRVIQSDYHPNLENARLSVRAVVTTVPTYEEDFWADGRAWLLVYPNWRMAIAYLVKLPGKYAGNPYRWIGNDGDISKFSGQTSGAFIASYVRGG